MSSLYSYILQRVALWHSKLSICRRILRFATKVDTMFIFSQRCQELLFSLIHLFSLCLKSRQWPLPINMKNWGHLPKTTFFGEGPGIFYFHLVLEFSLSKDFAIIISSIHFQTQKNNCKKIPPAQPTKTWQVHWAWVAVTPFRGQTWGTKNRK